MISKAEIDTLIGVINSVLKLIESLDPALMNNRIILDINAALDSLQKMGL